MKQIEVTDIMNLNISKQAKLELIKLWLTSDMNFYLKETENAKRKWWQFWK